LDDGESRKPDGNLITCHSNGLIFGRIVCRCYHFILVRLINVYILQLFNVFNIRFCDVNEEQLEQLVKFCDIGIAGTVTGCPSTPPVPSPTAVAAASTTAPPTTTTTTVDATRR